MPAMLIAAGVLSVGGIVAALALVALRHLNATPRTFSDDSSEWPYADVDYLWWDEGIHWAAR
jgi:hypothetical protein